MSRLGRPSIAVFVLLLLASVVLASPASAQVTVDIGQGKSPRGAVLRPAPAEIRNIAVIPAAQGVSLEIFSSRPVVPQITKIAPPPRLIVDIPNSIPAMTNDMINVGRAGVKFIRISRVQQTPPSTRVIIDLDGDATYGMVASGTQFTVELHPIADPGASQQAAASQPVNPNDVPPAAPYYSPLESNTQQPAQPRQPAVPQPQQPPATRAAQPAVAAPEVIPTARPASDVGADLGTSLTAGADTAVMQLARGGELRVCPGTSLSLTPTNGGRELMLGMSTGSFEVHYAMAAGSDTIVTPDFRMQLTGPGLFQFAFSADARGNTCVRSLPSNQGAVTVSEVMGDGSYVVRPNESVEFRGGRIAARDQSVPPGCGCPATGVPIMRAENKPPQAPIAPSPVSSVEPPHQALPPPGETAISVDAPLVFRGEPSQQPAPEVANLAMKSEQPRAPLQAAPPPSSAPPASEGYKVSDAKVQPRQSQKKGFFAKVKGFFGGIFH